MCAFLPICSGGCRDWSYVFTRERITSPNRCDRVERTPFPPILPLEVRPHKLPFVRRARAVVVDDFEICRARIVGSMFSSQYPL